MTLRGFDQVSVVPMVTSEGHLIVDDIFVTAGDEVKEAEPRNVAGLDDGHPFHILAARDNSASEPFRHRTVPHEISVEKPRRLFHQRSDPLVKFEDVRKVIKFWRRLYF